MLSQAFRNLAPLDSIAFAILGAVTAANIFLTIMVPQVQQALNDMRLAYLPLSAYFVIHWTYLFWAFTFIWPAVAIVVFFRASIGAARLSLLALIIAAAMQAAFMLLALFLPFCGVIILTR